MTLAHFPTGLRVRTCAVAAACLLAAACGAGSQDVSFLGGYYSDATRSAFHYAGAERDFETVIIGNSCETLGVLFSDNPADAANINTVTTSQRRNCARRTARPPVRRRTGARQWRRKARCCR